MDIERDSVKSEEVAISKTETTKTGELLKEEAWE